MTKPLTPQTVLRQVLAFVASSQNHTAPQVDALSAAFADIQTQTELEDLALETAQKLLSWALMARRREVRLAELLERQTQQLMDVNELTADMSSSFTRDYRELEHQVEIAKAARDRLKVVVEALFRALDADLVRQGVCLDMAKAYLRTYERWLESYKYERAALHAFANALG